MLDEVVVVNELVDFAWRNKKGDFEKAFDSISWEYLLYIFKRVNFESKWIQACVYSNSLFILINGSLAMDFQARRELCQRDLVSMFLFIIVVEGMAILLKNARSSLSFHPFELSDNFEFDLMQFANNIIYHNGTGIMG